MSESGHSLFLYNIPKDVVLWVVFFAISSKIGKRHLRIRRWIGKQREGVFYIPFMDMNHSSAVGCGGLPWQLLFKQL